jgi:hypothetical protein
MRGSRSGSTPKRHGSATLLASSCFLVPGNGSSLLQCALAWLFLDKKNATFLLMAVIRLMLLVSSMTLIVEHGN